VITMRGEATGPAAGAPAVRRGGPPRPDARRAGVIRVLLVDDHALLRAGMARLLELAYDVSVVGSAGSGAEGLEMAAALHPDVVLMDLSMPGMSGVEATRRLLAAQPDAAVVVLTSFADPDLVTDALDAGRSATSSRTRNRTGWSARCARPRAGSRRSTRERRGSC
jgi:CheY-like chemotaxis protein